MEENNTGFDEFAAAFGVEDGNHTEPAEEVEASEPEAETEETPMGATEDAEGGEEEGGNEDKGEEEKPAEDGAEPNSTTPEKYTIKIDKETREVTRDELIELAQKGGAFDRVKEQLTETRKTVENLQNSLAKSKELSDMLKAIAEGANTTPEELLKRVRINLRMSSGETEKEAAAKIEAEDAKRQIEKMKSEQKPAQESAQDRMNREVAEFRAEYPGVELNEALISELIPDVQGGMSLTKAYQKLAAKREEAERAALQDKIKQLETQLEAEKKNKRNKASTPGSQKDSGGQRGNSEFDDFLSAFQ